MTSFGMSSPVEYDCTGTEPLPDRQSASPPGFATPQLELRRDSARMTPPAS
jgi:hypothetical protein